jgi:hypothetical protein
MFDHVVDDQVKQCAMFNLDNCFECSRQNGYPCQPEDFSAAFPRWNCNDPDLSRADAAGCTGHASWNLMSRNGQEIVSGIYVYAVGSDDARFEDFVGKFAVVR